MVSGIFTHMEGMKAGGMRELTIMRHPEDAVQWRALDKHVIYSGLLFPPGFIETPEMSCTLRRRYMTTCFTLRFSFPVPVIISRFFKITLLEKQLPVGTGVDDSRVFRS